LSRRHRNSLLVRLRRREGVAPLTSSPCKPSAPARRSRASQVLGLTRFAAVLVLVFGPWTRAARADGAFPDAQSVLLARDRPHQMVLAANFGLVWSEDDGQTWSYSCESPETVGGYRYTMGPPSSGGASGAVSGDRIFAIANPEPGAAVSSDDACTWTSPGGALQAPGNPPHFANDLFPDPSDPSRVFLLAAPYDPDNPDLPGGVYRSTDGGRTYAGPIYTPQAQGRPMLTGVEVSASAAGTVYVTWYDVVTHENPTRVELFPHLARSLDGGETWTDQSLEGALGLLKPYLAAVDPADPQVLFLRTISPDGAATQQEALAVSRDGGVTWAVPVTEPGGSMKGFVRRGDGSWFALATPAAADAGVPTSVLYQSADGGRTFARAPLAYHGKGLGERDGTLFLATDNVVDLVALVSSTDAVNWKPRLRFEDITAIKGCVYARCRDACDTLLGNAPIFSPEVCSRSSTATGGKGGGGSGCGCAVEGGDESGEVSRVGELGRAGGAGALALLLALARRERSRVRARVRVGPAASEERLPGAPRFPTSPG